MFPFLILATVATTPPAFEPLPTKPQLAWHAMEYYAFVHFGPNTFTGQEWGHGTEDPKIFNPAKLDCNQWVKTFKDAGMKGVIITAKHHDGFCLWPSKFSTHTVAQSPWRDGKGDVLKELSDACKKHGLKFGVYVSPWDRNHPAYGTPEYNQVFVNTLTEVLSNYGEVFEVWFDGANGEGPNGKKQVYDWPLFISTVRKLQPNAVIFSDAGPDVRWVGNEEGYAAETNWGMLKRDELFPGTPRYRELTEGHVDGTHWVPAECDVSIRPGWFWRSTENDKVKSVDKLMDIWFGSVGQGANLLLNVPPNSDGLISDIDAQRLMEFRKARERVLSNPIEIRLVADADTGGRTKSIEALLDGNRSTHWRSQGNDGFLILRLAKKSRIVAVRLQEAIEFGQRISSFAIAADVNGEKSLVAQGTTIGNKRIVRFEPVETDWLMVTVRGRAQPALTDIRVFGEAK